MIFCTILDPMTDQYITDNGIGSSDFVGHKSGKKDLLRDYFKVCGCRKSKIKKISL